MTRVASTAVAGMVIVASLALVNAQGPAPGHPDDYSRADIEHGARVYAENCDRCHGPDGSGVSGFNLASGKFRSAATDQQLRAVITAGFPAAGMPPTRLDPVDLSGLVAYLRNMNAIDRGSLKPGNADRGRAIVEGKGACLSCHRIDGVGSYKGPNLSAIGASKSAGIIERSLVDPRSQLWPINRPVRVVTKSGTVINGRRLNEDSFTVQIVDEAGRLGSFSKQELRELRIFEEPQMPSYKDELTSEELSDVLSYLLTLKGPR